jgi:hypothetical protein
MNGTVDTQVLQSSGMPSSKIWYLFCLIFQRHEKHKSIFFCFKALKLPADEFLPQQIISPK